MDSKAIHERLAQALGDKITGSNLEALQPWSLVATEAIADVAAFAKADPELSFDNLLCLSAVDYPKETPPRMEIVYHLYSYTHDHAHVLALQAKVQLAEQRAPAGRRDGDAT